MIDSASFDLVNVSLGLLPNLFVIAVGITLWLTAPWLSRILTKGGNGNLTMGGVTREDLFTSIFLGLGVYFIMDSFSNVVGWAHYFAINRTEGGFKMDVEPSYYDLTERVLTLIGGIALTWTCRTWGRRLAQKLTSEQVGAQNP